VLVKREVDGVKVFCESFRNDTKVKLAYHVGPRVASENRIFGVRVAWVFDHTFDPNVADRRRSDTGFDTPGDRGLPLDFLDGFGAV
jgi:hypothetical protein